MLTLVLMKIAADLALYYTFAGFIASFFGASSGGMLLALAVQTAAFTLAYAVRRFGPWRFLPLVLLALRGLVPGAGIADLIVMVPPALYEIYLISHNIYEPDWSQQVRIFSVFWKVFLAFSLLCALFRAAEQVKSIVLPFGVMMLMCSVLLTRSLRHEPQVYCQAKYQAVNLLLLCAAGACAMFLSSQLFLGACLGILRFLYSRVVSPILMALGYILLEIIKGIVWLFSLFKFKIPVSETEQQISGESAMELLELDGEAAPPQWLQYIAIAIGIVVAAAILIRVFRALAGRGSSQGSERKSGEARISLAREKGRSDDAPAGSPTARVRAQYKKFLRLAATRSLGPEMSDTSLDVSKKCRGAFDDEAVRELRDIYIEARYGAAANWENAQQAKKLYGKIKKSAERAKPE